MASYDIEHNIKEEATRKPTRPDMSSFFSAYQQAFSSPDRHNQHAEPTPADIETVLSLYGSSLNVRLDEIERMSLDPDERSEIIARLTDMRDQVSKMDKIEPAPQSYVDSLERVPRKELKKGMTCPICAVDFIDDEFPLVVRLPCHEDHLFDLECIAGWLCLQATCPLDRKNLLKKKEVPKPPVDDDEEEYDEFYA